MTFDWTTCITFSFEDCFFWLVRDEGIEELEKVVDILIVISNQKLLSFDKNLTFIRSFEIVDEVLYQSIEVKTLSIKTLFLLEYVKMKLFKGILNLMARPGLINLDFADLKTVMESTGRAFIGTGSQTSSFFN